MTVKVLKAVEEDIDEISKIAMPSNKLHYERVPQEFKKPKIINEKKYLEKGLKNNEFEVFKAVEDGKILGYATLYIWNMNPEVNVFPKVGFIGDITVDKKAQGKGVGKALIKHLEKVCRKKGLGALDLMVYDFNLCAKGFYNKMGFKDLLIRKRKIL